MHILIIIWLFIIFIFLNKSDKIGFMGDFTTSLENSLEDKVTLMEYQAP